MIDVADAIYAAAPRGDGRILGPATPSDAQIEGTRMTIVRFLENVPDDAIAMDIRAAIEAMP